MREDESERYRDYEAILRSMPIQGGVTGPARSAAWAAAEAKFQSTVNSRSIRVSFPLAFPAALLALPALAVAVPHLRRMRRRSLRGFPAEPRPSESA